MKKRTSSWFIAAFLTFTVCMLYAFPAFAKTTADPESVASGTEQTQKSGTSTEAVATADYIEENEPAAPSVPGLYPQEAVSESEKETTEGKKKKVTASGPAAENKELITSPEPPKETYLGEFTTTAYCNCDKCSSGFSLTYSGSVPKANHTISADISKYPIGTQLRIEEIIYTVEDVGTNIHGNWLDLYFDSHQDALNYGQKTVKVYAVEQ